MTLDELNAQEASVREGPEEPGASTQRQREREGAKGLLFDEGEREQQHSCCNANV